MGLLKRLLCAPVRPPPVVICLLCQQAGAALWMDGCLFVGPPPLHSGTSLGRYRCCADKVKTGAVRSGTIMAGAPQFVGAAQPQRSCHGERAWRLPDNISVLDPARRRGPHTIYLLLSCVLFTKISSSKVFCSQVLLLQFARPLPLPCHYFFLLQFPSIFTLSDRWFIFVLCHKFFLIQFLSIFMLSDIWSKSSFLWELFSSFLPTMKIFLNCVPPFSILFQFYNA